jgi:hypothetical protein
LKTTISQSLIPVLYDAFHIGVNRRITLDRRIMFQLVEALETHLIHLTVTDDHELASPGGRSRTARSNYKKYRDETGQFQAHNLGYYKN